MTVEGGATAQAQPPNAFSTLLFHQSKNGIDRYRLELGLSPRRAARKKPEEI
jgi:hypothetical protein